MASIALRGTGIIEVKVWVLCDRGPHGPGLRGICPALVPTMALARFPGPGPCYLKTKAFNPWAVRRSATSQPGKNITSVTAAMRWTCHDRMNRLPVAEHGGE